jgi:hypothetical protein
MVRANHTQHPNSGMQFTPVFAALLPETFRVVDNLDTLVGALLADAKMKGRLADLGGAQVAPQCQ